MIILRSQRTIEKRKKTIAVFGIGLIGSDIIRAINNRAPNDQNNFLFSWQNKRIQSKKIKIIENHLIKSLKKNTSLQIIWSAGSAGFDSPKKETLKEIENFDAILDMSEKLKYKFPESNISFYHISSAGGLFEGQTQINKSSMPLPLRPYGKMKKQQEDLLLSSSSDIVKKIYRPSSVYGYAEPKMRSGLIPTLIKNGLLHKETLFFGNLNTLRDYIWVGDVSDYICDDILSEEKSQTDSTVFLASTKPSSLFEIKKKIECVINRKLYISISPKNKIIKILPFQNLPFHLD